jgi:hypothetical protein
VHNETYIPLVGFPLAAINLPESKQHPIATRLSQREKKPVMSKYYGTSSMEILDTEAHPFKETVHPNPSHHLDLLIFENLKRK